MAPTFPRSIKPPRTFAMTRLISIGSCRRIALGIALALIAASARAGYPEGATAYHKGDFATAMKEWLPAARKGDQDARFGLGVMYANGQGTTRDQKEAVRWYRLAADQGHAIAQNNLCVCYMDGLGVEQRPGAPGRPRRGR
jgi:uncharacterized protein